MAAGLAVLMTTTGASYAHRMQQEQRAAEQTQLMAGMIRGLFETADPYTLGTRRGDSLLLERGLRIVEHDLSGEPDLQVELLTTLGDSHESVGAALAIQGRVLSDAGRYAAAEPVLREALSILASPGAPSGRARQEARVSYGELLTRTGRAEEAEPILRSAARALAARTAARHDRSVLHAKAALAANLRAQGRSMDAEAILREIWEICNDHYGSEHPRTRAARQALMENSTSTSPSLKAVS